jgi:hypothetical protein
MNLGSIFEVSLAINGWKSSGSAEVCQNVLTIGETTLGNTSEKLAPK